MSKHKVVLLVSASFCAGIVIGGYLFSQSQPRSFIAIHRCQDCLTHQDFLGLLASVGIQKFSSLIPVKICETDKTVAIKHPFSWGPVHYVIFPKKDIKNIGEISEADVPYLIDALRVTKWIIDERKLSKYRFYTNGPGSQDVTYLHFHLVAQ